MTSNKFSRGSKHQPVPKICKSKLHPRFVSLLPITLTITIPWYLSNAGTYTARGNAYAPPEPGYSTTPPPLAPFAILEWELANNSPGVYSLHALILTPDNSAATFDVAALRPDPTNPTAARTPFTAETAEENTLELLIGDPTLTPV